MIGAIKTFSGFTNSDSLPSLYVMENALASMRGCMSENHLKVNDSEREFILMRFTATTQKSINRLLGNERTSV